jgi:hypothetical protein
MRTLRFLVFSTAAFSVATAQPDTIATAARVDNPRTVVVGERSVVDIYVSQFQDTLIVLPTSEKVRQTFVGDSANWVLTTGKSEESTRYISVKVKDPIVKQTTVNVLSDHDKSYTFRLIMSGDHCDSKVFIDPDSQLSQELARPAVFVPAAEVDRAKKEAADAKTAAGQAIEQEQTKAQIGRSEFVQRQRIASSEYEMVEVIDRLKKSLDRLLIRQIEHMSSRSVAHDLDRFLHTFRIAGSDHDISSHSSGALCDRQANSRRTSENNDPFVLEITCTVAFCVVLFHFAPSNLQTPVRSTRDGADVHTIHA